MITGCMQSSSWHKGSHAAGQPKCLEMRLGQLSIGSDGSKSGAFLGSWIANVLAVVRDCPRSTSQSSAMHYVRIQMNLEYQDSGMARRSPYSSSKTGVLRLAFGNASACFGIWGFGFASLVRRWRMPIRRSRQHIKKLHRLAQDDGFDVWAVDEVRFEQHGSACRMWVPPEIADPVLLHHPTRKGVGYFGAVRIRDGKFLYCREDESFNGETFFSFLKKLRRVSCHACRHVVVILDNVKYHHARLHLEWREKSQGHMTLEFMPPYSPELNPIERVWKLTRRMATHNRYFPTLASVISSVENVFSHWRTENDTLRRLCAI